MIALAYTALGLAVSHRPPSALDASYIDFLAHRAIIDVAWIFTASCLWYVLVPYGIAAFILAARAPAWRARAYLSVVTTIVAWQTSNLLKELFRRPRPAHWEKVHETSWSYSSGHAMFAVVVYGLWAYFAWRSDLPAPVRRALTALLVFWALGVNWSRLALGAHYPTDLAGGFLLGAIFVCIAAALVPRAFEPPAVAGTEPR